MEWTVLLDEFNGIVHTVEMFNCSYSFAYAIPRRLPKLQDRASTGLLDFWPKANLSIEQHILIGRPIALVNF